MKPQKTGLVLGKFMPFHKGHEALIDFAKTKVDRLFVVVDHVPENDYPIIPGQKRVDWIRAYAPSAEVFFLPKVMPQLPEETPEFWTIWEQALLDILPVKPDFIFASETYGENLAKILDSQFCVFDIERKKVPISATEIRTNLVHHWEDISLVVRRDLGLKICIFGPESTGKTTLAQQLGNYFEAPVVLEFAREFLETNFSRNPDFELSAQDIKAIVLGQCESQQKTDALGARLSFADTDVLLTSVWDQWLFKGANKTFLQQQLPQQCFDHYLLMKPDIAWEADQVRFFPERKQQDQFFADCEVILKQQKKSYTIISGAGDLRLKKATEVVKKVLKEKSNYATLASRF